MDIDQEIAKLLGELGRLSQQERSDPDLNNLTVLNFQILTYIFFCEQPPRMRDIAEALGLSLPSVSTIIDRLEETDMVMRVHDTADRRVVQVHLKPKGRSIIQSQIEKTTAGIKKGLAGLSDKDKRTVLKFFQSYTATLQQQSASGAP